MILSQKTEKSVVIRSQRFSHCKKGKVSKWEGFLWIKLGTLCKKQGERGEKPGRLIFSAPVAPLSRARAYSQGRNQSQGPAGPGQEVLHAKIPHSRLPPALPGHPSLPGGRGRQFLPRPQLPGLPHRHDPREGLQTLRRGRQRVHRLHPGLRPHAPGPLPPGGGPGGGGTAEEGTHFSAPTPELGRSPAGSPR